MCSIIESNLPGVIHVLAYLRSESFSRKSRNKTFLGDANLMLQKSQFIGTKLCCHIFFYCKCIQKDCVTSQLQSKCQVITSLLLALESFGGFTKPLSNAVTTRYLRKHASECFPRFSSFIFLCDL